MTVPSTGLAPPARRPAAAMLAALLVALLAAPAAWAQGGPSEHAIKATFLAKFGTYVEWPAGAMASGSAPLTLCIAGEDPFGPELAKATDGQTAGNHPLAVKHLKTASRDAGCHILFIGGSAEQRVAQALDAVRGAPVLTVTDAARGGDAGMVHFVLKDNRVRFEIDDDAAQQSGLAISSKLLTLALSVKSRK